MKSYVIIQTICLLASIICLGLPYVLAGDWLIMLFFLAMATFWILMKKRSVFWSASVLLLTFVFLAAVGVLANFSTPLMVIACTAALACWDLTNFGRSVVVGEPLETVLRLERHHLQSLGLAVSGGLILAFGSSYLSLQIPFLGMVILVLFAVGSLTYGLQSLIKKNI